MNRPTINTEKTRAIKEICQPLENFFDIGGFSYLKIYPDLSRIHLDYHPEWTNYFYDNIETFTSNENLTELSSWEPGFSTIYTLEDPCIPDATLFDIGDGVVISNSLENGTELCFFEGKHSKNNANLIINNIDLLQLFILSFRDKAKKLIEEEEKSPFFIPNTDSHPVKRSFGFNDRTKLDFINSLNKKNSITSREYECLCLLTQGLSSKAIAKQLNISAKTVDRHFENLRIKYDMNKRSDLIQLI